MELKGCPIRQYWEGFECVRKHIRQRDRSGPPLILKLKDWPATGDFAEMLPEWLRTYYKRFRCWSTMIMHDR